MHQKILNSTKNQKTSKSIRERTIYIPYFFYCLKEKGIDRCIGGVIKTVT